MRQIKQHDYEYKTKPYAHQHEAFIRSRDEENFALLMEMGTGKTKVTIDTAAWLYAKGEINFLFVVAPNEVHRNWIDREVPAHLPDWVEYRACVWSSKMKKKDWDDFAALWDKDFKGLRILAVNVEAWGVGEKIWKMASKDPKKPKFGSIVRQIFNAFLVMLVVDESSKIKTPGVRRTRRLTNHGKYAKFRRILTGTLITNSPLDSYSQFRFLDPEILGIGNFLSFKHRYARWKTERNWRAGRNYEVLIGYKHLDELKEKIDKQSFRVLKKDCLDLPDKIYVRRPVELEKEQKRIYDQLKKYAILELKNSDEKVLINLVLTKYLRLQQILGGFIPAEHPDDPPEPIFDNPEKNPRIKALFDVIDQIDDKVIIWARFRAEIEMIREQLAIRYGSEKVVTLYGGTNTKVRGENINRFQGQTPIIDPDTHARKGWEDIPEAEQARFFVSNQHSGGYGLTLTAATYMIYYSSDFSLEARLQSEDRAHRIGQKNTVTYIDLETVGTIDTNIVQALVSKKSLADMISGDNPEKWLEPLVIQGENPVESGSD
jgi:hypothetical protein